MYVGSGEGLRHRRVPYGVPVLSGLWVPRAAIGARPECRALDLHRRVELECSRPRVATSSLPRCSRWWTGHLATLGERPGAGSMTWLLHLGSECLCVPGVGCATAHAPAPVIAVSAQCAVPGISSTQRRASRLSAACLAERGGLPAPVVVGHFVPATWAVTHGVSPGCDPVRTNGRGSCSSCLEVRPALRHLTVPLLSASLTGRSTRT